MSTETQPPQMTRLAPPERSRTYHYGDGRRLPIKDVVAVCVRPSGSHRLETADGRRWIVAAGWQAIELDVDEWTF